MNLTPITYLYIQCHCRSLVGVSPFNLSDHPAISPLVLSAPIIACEWGGQTPLTSVAGRSYGQCLKLIE
jgi:hypothetical protein